MSTQVFRPWVAATMVVAGASAGILSMIRPAHDSYSIMSQVAVLCFAALSFFPLVRALPAYRGAVVIVVLGLFALAIETVALVTHIPYGHFAYSDLLGYTLFGLTPVSVFVSWSPLVIGVYTLVQRLQLSYPMRVFAGACGLVLVDLVLDPGAVRSGLWAWEQPGWYYGVPVVNFVGWCVSGAIGMILIDRMVGNRALPDACMSTLMVMLAFWTGVCVAAGYVIPSFLGFVLLGGMGWRVYDTTKKYHTPE